MINRHRFAAFVRDVYRRMLLYLQSSLVTTSITVPRSASVTRTLAKGGG